VKQCVCVCESKRGSECEREIEREREREREREYAYVPSCLTTRWATTISSKVNLQHATNLKVVSKDQPSLSDQSGYSRGKS